MSMLPVLRCCFGDVVACNWLPSRSQCRLGNVVNRLKLIMNCYAQLYYKNYIHWLHLGRHFWAIGLMNFIDSALWFVCGNTKFNVDVLCLVIQFTNYLYCAI